MQVKVRYVPRHKEKGYFLDQYAQPVDDFTKAISFKSPDDDYAQFMMGRFRPDNPLEFTAAKMIITYTLEGEHIESLSKDRTSA